MKKRVNYNVLELKSRSQFVPAKGYDKQIELIRIKKNVDFNYQLPLDENLKSGWWEQLALGKDILRNFLAYPEVHFFLAIHNGVVIGSFDMIVLPDRQVEIKNFGITSEETDFEVRAMFLSKAVDYCFQYDPKRIFFHASEFEKMSSISNYLSQGFSISALPSESNEGSPIKEQSALQANFLINLN